MHSSSPNDDHAEFIIQKEAVLVSKTDLFGTITECNDAFEFVSGFSKKELIGQPHNLVRHGDVPAEVFADMWRTLKQGFPWCQIVKNRRKDGGYYWVEARVTPIYQQGKLAGYMSVRHAASRAQIATAQTLYQEIKAGKASLYHGQVRRHLRQRLGARLAKFNRPVLSYPLLALLAYVLPYAVYANVMQYSWQSIFWVSAWGLMIAFLVGVFQQRARSQLLQDLSDITDGTVLAWPEKDFDSVRAQVAAKLQTIQLISNECQEALHSQRDQTKQLKRAMDQMSTNVLIANNEFDIVYANKQMLKFLQERQAAIQAQIPAFELDKLIGSNMDIFHKNPAHNRAMLSALSEPTEAKLILNDLHLILNIVPVMNRHGQLTSIVLEWQDKTDEYQLIEQVDATVKFTKEGLLDRRIDLSKTSGVARSLSESVNALLDNVEAPISETVEVALALSAGRLDRYIQGNFLGRFALIQDSVNVAVHNLASMLADTQAATHKVLEGADNIYQSNQRLSLDSHRQSDALSGAALNMQQMNQQVHSNAQTSEQAAQKSIETAKLANNGVQVMAAAIDSMQGVYESSQKIQDIIGLIDSIAFQTNLLALNAAVEAARAGGHGRGFAVVAAEVRSLAQKSAESAQQIRGLIEETVSKISEGTNNVQHSGQTLKQMNGSIEQVNQTVEGLSHFNYDQAKKISNLTDVMQKINESVKVSTENLDESAATAQQLSHTSADLSNSIKQFVLPKGVVSKRLAASQLFDFSQARRAHRQWRINARAYINDVAIDFDRQTAQNSHVCALGQWLHGVGQSYQDLPSFQQLMVTHQSMHEFIATVIDHKDQGEILLANKKLSELESLSDQVIAHIYQLESDLEQHLAQGLGSNDVVKPFISIASQSGQDLEACTDGCCSSSSKRLSAPHFELVQAL